MFGSAASLRCPNFPGNRSPSRAPRPVGRAATHTAQIASCISSPMAVAPCHVRCDTGAVRTEIFDPDANFAQVLDRPVQGSFRQPGIHIDADCHCPLIRNPARTVRKIARQRAINGKACFLFATFCAASSLLCSFLLLLFSASPAPFVSAFCSGSTPRQGSR